jgi:hypothetical protein
MALPKNIVSDFQSITRYPLSIYLNGYVNFIDKHRVNVLNYYAGNASKPNEESFAKLWKLLEDAENVNHMIEIHRDRLISGAYWELIETLSDMQISLHTIDNSSKWLRSSISKNNFNPQIEVQYVLKQSETLEMLANNNGYSNKESDWIKIALRNDLREEGYTPDGGVLLVTGFSNRLAIKLKSVVDNVFGEKVYGIDLDQKITFNSADDDLKALTYKETIVQSITILANLRQGQTPEFSEDGIQASLVVGTNRFSIAYPILFRQFYATFQKDDSLQSLTVTRIENTSDALSIAFSVETRLGEEFETITEL